MNDPVARNLPWAEGRVVDVCQAVAGELLLRGRREAARDVLGALAQTAETKGETEGFLRAVMGEAERGGAGRGAGKRAPVELRTNLWFIQACFALGYSDGHPAGWRESLLPLMKRIGQGVVSGAFPDMKMDDGGTLVATGRAKGVRMMEANALWYSALMVLAEELRRAGDTSGDHFERLAGRFRRTFLKTYWCDAHECLCTPESQLAPGHGGAGYLPDADQLLAVTLAFSPLPRTKQRQMAEAVKKDALGPRGVRVRIAGRARKMLDVESPMHLAWLAEAYLKSSEGAGLPAATADARSWLAPLAKTLEEGRPLARYYAGESPAPVPGNEEACGPAMAEVRRVWALLAGRGNSA